jgi:hypothetical protein
MASMPSEPGNRSMFVSRRWLRTLLPAALIAAFVAVVLLSHLRMYQTFDRAFTSPPATGTCSAEISASTPSTRRL